MWQASILVRALVHGWRHMGGAHMRVDGVAVALVSGLDSCDSPSALSVPRAHSSGRAALESPLRCSALYVPPVLVPFISWCQILDGGMEASCLHAAVKGLAPGDEGDEHSGYTEHLRRSAEGPPWIHTLLDTPYLYSSTASICVCRLQ